jgi:hypothetical protein
LLRRLPSDYSVTTSPFVVVPAPSMMGAASSSSSAAYIRISSRYVIVEVCGTRGPTWFDECAGAGCDCEMGLQWVLYIFMEITGVCHAYPISRSYHFPVIPSMGTLQEKAADLQQRVSMITEITGALWYVAASDACLFEEDAHTTPKTQSYDVTPTLHNGNKKHKNTTAWSTFHSAMEQGRRVKQHGRCFYLRYLHAFQSTSRSW